MCGACEKSPRPLIKSSRWTWYRYTSVFSDVGLSEMHYWFYNWLNRQPWRAMNAIWLLYADIYLYGSVMALTKDFWTKNCEHCISSLLVPMKSELQQSSTTIHSNLTAKFSYRSQRTSSSTIGASWMAILGIVYAGHNLWEEASEQSMLGTTCERR